MQCKVSFCIQLNKHVSWLASERQLSSFPEFWLFQNNGSCPEQLMTSEHCSMLHILQYRG